MDTVSSPRQLGRSIWAVFAGFAVAVLLTLATDFVLHATRVFPPMGQQMPDPLLFLATAYRTVIGVATSWLTARLAPYRPMAHALAGGAIGFVLSLVGAIATWNGGPAYRPHWYPVLLVVLALPTAWAGGALRQGQQNR